MLAGATAGLWLLPGLRPVGWATFNVETSAVFSHSRLDRVHAISFAVFSKVFAHLRAVAPDPLLDRPFRYIALEIGLVFGAFLGAAGLAGSLWAVGLWGAHSFGRLDVYQTLRVVIPCSLGASCAHSVRNGADVGLDAHIDSATTALAVQLRPWPPLFRGSSPETWVRDAPLLIAPASGRQHRSATAWEPIIRDG